MCVEASVVPLWHKIKVIFRFLPVDAGSISGEGGVFELDQFASRLFNTLFNN